MNYVYIMAVIAVLMIVIASINYTNLTTARATSRGKEIGIRKVGGASKHVLRSQFLGESVAEDRAGDCPIYDFSNDDHRLRCWR